MYRRECTNKSRCWTRFHWLAAAVSTRWRRAPTNGAGRGGVRLSRPTSQTARPSHFLFLFRLASDVFFIKLIGLRYRRRRRIHTQIKDRSSIPQCEIREQRRAGCRPFLIDALNFDDLMMVDSVYY